MPESDLNARKRRIRYRAVHRGMKEMDLLLGRLADDVLPGLDEAGVAAFELLLEVPDADLLSFVSGQQVALPERVLDNAHARALLERLKGYRFFTGSYGENL